MILSIEGRRHGGLGFRLLVLDHQSASGRKRGLLFRVEGLRFSVRRPDTRDEIGLNKGCLGRECTMYFLTLAEMRQMRGQPYDRFDKLYEGRWPHPAENLQESCGPPLVRKRQDGPSASCGML